MAEFVVTGKKGAGKGIVSVGQIRDYLQKRNVIATNHDLFLHRLIGPYSKECRVIRIPDKPKLHDLRCIGAGNPTVHYDCISVTDTDGKHLYYDYIAHDEQPDFDESKNGLLVLDELGSWFNARGFADKDRQPVLDWLIHSRKLGWDIIYEIQDISMTDKQVRDGFAEHVVYCRRTDRLPIPLIGSILPIKLPRIHLGVVLYGTSATAPKVDTWLVRPNEVKSGYNTFQKFTDRYQHGAFSYLPPFYTHGKYKMPRCWRSRMRLTKIVARKWSRLFCFLLGLLIVPLIGSIVIASAPADQQPAVNQVQAAPVVDETALDFLQGYVIQGVVRLPGKLPIMHLVKDEESPVYSTDSLIAQGCKVAFVNNNQIVVTKNGVHHEIYRR